MNRRLIVETAFNMARVLSGKFGNGLGEEEREAHSDGTAGLRASDVGHRLCNARQQNSNGQCIGNPARQAGNVRGQGDRGIDREVLHTVGVRPHGTPVPVRPFHPVGPKGV